MCEYYTKTHTIVQKKKRFYHDCNFFFLKTKKGRTRARGVFRQLIEGPHRKTNLLLYFNVLRPYKFIYFHNINKAHFGAHTFLNKVHEFSNSVIHEFIHHLDFTEKKKKQEIDCRTTSRMETQKKRAYITKKNSSFLKKNAEKWMGEKQLTCVYICVCYICALEIFSLRRT